ncbi:TRL-like protein family [bacterium]|nr:TRL-like protein family [bacterium]
MKKLLALGIFLILTLAVAPSAQASYEPWGFAIYNGTKEPADYTIPNATSPRKIGSATCKTVLGIVNWGDCSIRTAMKNGNISKVSFADWEKKYIVVYGTKTLKVYGY